MKLLGGRPMKYVGHAFYDRIGGEQVNYYRDSLGRNWMATSRWALFRVPVTEKGGAAIRAMSENY